jgi:selenocysteine lyase/cysteine desulfurase
VHCIASFEIERGHELLTLHALFRTGRIRKTFHKASTYTLLDAAALATTAPLDLSDAATAPDFTAISFYKIFGFPNIGALIVRKASAHVLNNRRYFGGGTGMLKRMPPSMTASRMARYRSTQFSPLTTA